MGRAAFFPRKLTLGAARALGAAARQLLEYVTRTIVREQVPRATPAWRS